MFRAVVYLLLIASCILATHSAIVYPDYKTHACARNCDQKPTPMTCFYNFTLDYYYTNTLECGNCLRGVVNDCSAPGCIIADGRQNLIRVYNRLMPGPPIQVCLNDRIILDINNEFVIDTTSIHWHGMHQRQTQYMDGVPYVTQCPIPPMTTFRYDFFAGTVGTHFYHSHSGMQRAEGAYGAFIVREKSDSNRGCYDYDLPEHTIVLSDWAKMPFTELIKRYQILKQPLENITSAVLVNNYGSTETNRVEPPKFCVHSGYRYRFRVIHAGAAMCPISIQIQRHRMRVIATDGHNVEPFYTDTIFIENGERVDFVLEANEIYGYYWMTFTAGEVCDFVQGLSVIEYDCQSKPNRKYYKSTLTSVLPRGYALNCINQPKSQYCRTYDQLTSRTVQTRYLYGKPDFKYFFAYDFYNYVEPKYRGPGDDLLITPIIDNITFAYPRVPLLLQGADPVYYCNRENRDVCPANEQVCSCTHVVEVPFNSLVELIFVHEGDGLDIGNHPLHLHGYAFNVMAVEKIGARTTLDAVRKLDAAGRLNRNFNNPTQKDTIGVPTGGYAILRFISDNQGYWFFHCHIENHAEEGMGFVLKTGNIPFVPDDFPTCGDYNVGRP